MASVISTPVSLETARLQLRKLQAGDEEFLASLDTNPDVMQHIHLGALSERAAMQWAKAQIEIAPHRPHLHKWIVERREDRASVGWIELSKFRGVFDPDESRRSDDIALGYQFAKAYWGRGFAPEAAGPVLAHAFDRLKLDRLVAFVHDENLRSRRVLEKLGFRAHPARRYVDEGGHRCRLYALPESDWRLRI